MKFGFEAMALQLSLAEIDLRLASVGDVVTRAIAPWNVPSSSMNGVVLTIAQNVEPSLRSIRTSCCSPTPARRRASLRFAISRSSSSTKSNTGSTSCSVRHESVRFSCAQVANAPRCANCVTDRSSGVGVESRARQGRTSYSAHFQVKGGKAPCKWKVASGAFRPSAPQHDKRSGDRHTLPRRAPTRLRSKAPTPTSHRRNADLRVPVTIWLIPRTGSRTIAIASGRGRRPVTPRA